MANFTTLLRGADCIRRRIGDGNDSWKDGEIDDAIEELNHARTDAETLIRQIDEARSELKATKQIQVSP